LSPAAAQPQRPWLRPATAKPIFYSYLTLPVFISQEVCQYLKNPNVSDTVLLQNIFQALSVYYNYSGQAACLNISQTTTSSLGSMGWSFQVSTQDFPEFSEPFPDSLVLEYVAWLFLPHLLQVWPM
jgi:hypothetical protein